MTSSRPSTRRKIILAIGLLALLLFIGQVIRQRSKSADLESWIAEARSKSLVVSPNDQCVITGLSRVPIIRRLLSRPVVVLLSHEDADFEALGSMRPCPVRITLGFQRPIGGQELQDLMFKLAAAIEASKKD